MSRKDRALALFIVFIWGANFTVTKLGLDSLPPMLLAALRYVFTALPAIFFVKRPRIHWFYWFAYGLTVGVGQLGCLFYAMNIGMPAGIASVILQSQVFFSLLFAGIILRESVQVKQIVGLIIAAIGLYFIGSAAGSNGASIIPLGAFLLTMIGAAFWAISNIVVRYAAVRTQRGSLDMMSLVVWSSLIPPLPFLALSLVLDTPETILNAMSSLNAQSIFSVLYLSFCATLFGYGAWSGLLIKYPTAKIAPLSLLVPVSGLITAYIVLRENLTIIQLTGSIVVLFGLVISNIRFSSIHYFRKKKGKLSM